MQNGTICALKHASKYFFEEIFGRFQLIYFFDLVLQMGANGAFGQELQIAAKNRLHTNFLRKLWTYHFLFSLWKLTSFA
jgi:hypothetical protein